jgi:hypothetical protein
MYLVVRNRTDGFGAQFQNRIIAYFYAKKNGLEYIHRPILSMEHNYNQDKNFIEDMENLMNHKTKFKSLNDVNLNLVLEFSNDQYSFFENNIDHYLKDMKEIREIFWSNKDRNVFKNNRFNVAVHIRRPNPHDSRKEGANTPLEYYIKIIKLINETYKDKTCIFHIFSQGSIEDFSEIKKLNIQVIFRLDEDIKITFPCLVAADILVTSRSSFSYTAALLNENIIYHLPFWHKHSSTWKIEN